MSHKPIKDGGEPVAVRDDNIEKKEAAPYAYPEYKGPSKEYLDLMGGNDDKQEAAFQDWYEGKKPCLDPDKMLGAADQYSGHEYPGEYEPDPLPTKPVRKTKLEDLIERLIEASQHAEYPQGDPPICYEAEQFLRQLRNRRESMRSLMSLLFEESK